MVGEFSDWGWLQLCRIKWKSQWQRFITLTSTGWHLARGRQNETLQKDEYIISLITETTNDAKDWPTYICVAIASNWEKWCTSYWQLGCSTSKNTSGGNCNSVSILVTLKLLQNKTKKNCTVNTPKNPYQNNPIISSFH